MRPLKGIITGNHKKTGLELKAESGLIAKLPYNKKYQVGEEIEVAYNFSKQEIVGIISEEIEDMEEPVVDNYDQDLEVY